MVPYRGFKWRTQLCCIYIYIYIYQGCRGRERYDIVSLYRRLAAAVAVAVMAVALAMAVATGRGRRGQEGDVGEGKL